MCVRVRACACACACVRACRSAASSSCPAASNFLFAGYADRPTGIVKYTLGGAMTGSSSSQCPSIPSAGLRLSI